LTVYVGLGGNMGDSAALFAQALRDLEEAGLWRVQAVSRLWRSPAWGFEGPEFRNAVAVVETDQQPQALLRAMLDFEARAGRQRGPSMGSRPIDLDLLAWEGLSVDEPGLTLPHPGTPTRRFVLEPFAELAPQLELAVLGRVDRLLELERQRDPNCWPIEQSWWTA